MQHFIKNRLIKVNYILTLLWLPIMLFTKSCQVSHVDTISPNLLPEQLRQENENMTSSPHEVILFCGNPGVGKSSLCNSIFNEHIFESGVSLGQGMTLEQQEHVYENKIYIDTPGLSDLKQRKEAAKAVGEALKKDKSYKVFFVLTLEAGRLRPDDFATINAICESITVPFEYGIIINKVSNEVSEEIKAKGGIGVALKPYLDILLNKKVSSKNLLIIKKDNQMDDVKNARLTDSSERKKLINFISEIKANKITPNKVKEIDINNYESKAQNLEKILNGLTSRPIFLPSVTPKLLFQIGMTAAMVTGFAILTKNTFSVDLFIKPTEEANTQAQTKNNKNLGNILKLNKNRAGLHKYQFIRSKL